MTATYSPPSYSSVNDTLLWVFSDANATDPTKVNYKYVVEVWVNGVKVDTRRVFPRPADGYGITDVSTVVRGYIAAVFTPTAGSVLSWQMGEGEFRTPSVELKVREEYNGTVGSIVLTTSTKVFYNNYLIRGEALNVLGTYANKPCTTRGFTIELTLDSYFYFIPRFSVLSTAYTVTVAGNSRTVTPATALTCQMINIAPQAINAEFSGAITSSTKSYEVTFGTTTYTVKLVCKGLYTNYKLHFLNRFGAFETMLFNKVRRRSTDIRKNSFNQLPYRVDGSGVASFTNNGNAIFYEQRTTYAVGTSEKLNVQTDFIDDTDYNWLGQLAASPLVYLEDNLQFFPVVITNSNYQPREYIVDRLTTLQFDIEFQTDRNTQFR